jgi:hypothetical protein
VYEGVRNQKRMAYYDLLSISIVNEFFKSAIPWSSQGLFQAIRLSVRRPYDIHCNSSKNKSIGV